MAIVIDKRTGQRRVMTKVFADLLVRLGRAKYAEADAGEDPKKKPAKKESKKKGSYKRRDMQAED